MFQNKKYLIFDFDGTIADSFQIHEDAFKEALKGYKVEFEYSKYAGCSTWSAMRQIFASNNQPLSDEDLRQIVENKQMIANQRYQTSLSFIPGAEPFIKAAFENDYVMAIASSGSRKNIDVGITRLGIGNYFKAIVTADDVARAKPCPDIFEKALSLINGKKEEALVFEDAASGVYAAAAAGIDVICVNNTELLQSEKPVGVKLGYADFIHLIRHLNSE